MNSQPTTQSPIHKLKYKRIFRLSALTTSGTVVSLISAFITLSLNARGLSREDFGALAVIQAYIALIAGLSTFDTWQPITRLGVKKPSRIGKLISFGILTDIATSALSATAAILILYMSQAAAGISKNYTNSAAIYCLVLFSAVSNTPKGYYRLTGKFTILTRNQIALAISNASASAILLLLNASLEHYVATYTAIAATYNSALLLSLLVEIKNKNINLINPTKTRNHLRMYRLFLLSAFGNNLLSTLANNKKHIALFLITSQFGESSAGTFSVAQRFSNMLSRLSQPINQVLFPEIIKYSESNDRSEIHRAANRITKFSLISCTLLFVVGAILSEQIITIGAGYQYTNASSTFTILLCSECIILAGMHLNPIIQSQKGTRPLILIEIISIFLFTVSATSAFYLYVSHGVALALLLTSISSYIATLAYNHHLTHA